MEYRVKYRDIPWPVALGVLPGKVIGTFIIKPALSLKRNWRYRLKKLGKNVLSFLILALICFGIYGLTESITEGSISDFLISIWQRLMAIL